MHLSRRLFAGVATIASLTCTTHPCSGVSSPFVVRFCSPVTSESCLRLVDAIEEANDEREALVNSVASFASVDALPPIHLHVSSFGGDLHAGLWVSDVLSKIENLHTHADGLVASAATLLTVVGSMRYMTPHSMMLLHQPSLSLGDDVKYHLLKDEFVNMKTCMDQLIDVYKSHSFLTETQIAQILANEQSFTSADCLKYGLIDKIK